MKSFIARRTLLAILLLGSVLFGAACRNANPTATPAPPTAILPTPLAPAPTAPALTDAPTAIVPTAVLPTQAPPPAATETSSPSAPIPTITPAEGNVVPPGNPPSNNAVVPTVDRGPLTGLYVAGLRYEPSEPRNNDQVKFFVTLINRTGRAQYYPVCVEIFRPGAKKSFGITNCDTLTIPAGTGQVFAGTWIGSGIKECIRVRARAVLREQGEGEVRWVFTTTNGGELWTDFNVCP